MYLKMAIFTGICLYTAYRGHLYFINKKQMREDRFAGLLPEYDPSDPEQLAQMTEK